MSVLWHRVSVCFKVSTQNCPNKLQSFGLQRGWQELSDSLFFDAFMVLHLVVHIKSESTGEFERTVKNLKAYFCQTNNPEVIRLQFCNENKKKKKKGKCYFWKSGAKFFSIVFHNWKKCGGSNTDLIIQWNWELRDVVGLTPYLCFRIAAQGYIRRYKHTTSESVRPIECRPIAPWVM